MLLPLPLAIIEDQTAIREALGDYLCAQPEFECVLTAVSVEDFLKQLPGLKVPPTLVLSDIGLPGKSGIEGIPLIKAQLPNVQVLMLSVFSDAARVFEAICAGGNGLPGEQLLARLDQLTTTARQATQQMSDVVWGLIKISKLCPSCWSG